MSDAKALEERNQRIANRLEEHEATLEELANCDVPFADRAQNSLNWLKDYREGRLDE